MVEGSLPLIQQATFNCLKFQKSMVLAVFIKVFQFVIHFIIEILNGVFVESFKIKFVAVIRTIFLDLLFEIKSQ